ncbi:MAG: hypothetical protein CO171_05565 [Syntrophobacterales bacterium CG_4_9_14_3_um_filter_49_8]|nr:MAG: hypothetical protein CO171_05565 [Syntrophobacterales bacterium CG_4_9_14_3_um_filter_49_8]
MERFIGQRWGIVAAVLFFLAIFSLNAAWGAGLTPEEVVLKYYHALQNRDFSGASQCVSRGMLAGKSQKNWANEMKDLYEGGKVEITDISVSPGSVSGPEAQVKNVMTSKDIINKNGVVEYNVEHLVLEDGLWKIDRTELEDSKILEP